MSSLVVTGVVDAGAGWIVRVRSTAPQAECPRCGGPSGRVHAWHTRRLVDLPLAGRPVLVEFRVRRLVCQAVDCRQKTFREQAPDLARRWARRTARLGGMIGQTAAALAGRAGSALLARLGVAVSRSTMLRALMALPIRATTTPTPKVISVDDVGLRRGRGYMTVVIDAVTHQRIDVLADRKAETLSDWLKTRSEVEVVCRDGSGAYAEAIRDGAPHATQVSDRWHLWHNLGKAVEKTIIAHSSCWQPAPAPDLQAVENAPRPVRAIDERTRVRHQAVHDLLKQGVGLLECARRLGWSLNTVKRYAHAEKAEQLLRPPRYGRTLVDPYRDHLRARLASEPDVPVTRLLAEIRERGYVGSANLLVRYLKQGRADPHQLPAPAPRRLVAWIMTRPAELPEPDRRHLHDLQVLCPHLATLTELVSRFAELLTGRHGDQLAEWMTSAEAADLPALHGFVRGLRMDLDAVVAGLTMPYSNGPIEGVNNKIKYLKRQMYGRASFALLRHRILLG